MFSWKSSKNTFLTDSTSNGFVFASGRWEHLARVCLIKQLQSFGISVPLPGGFNSPKQPSKKKTETTMVQVSTAHCQTESEKTQTKKTQPLKVFTINSGLRCSLATCVHADGTRLSTKETPTQQKLMVSDFQSLGLLRSRPRLALFSLRKPVRCCAGLSVGCVPQRCS